MSVQIKICGLSTPETIDAAVDAGATHVGLVHFEPSPRHVSLEDAAKLRARVPTNVKVVLLLVNQQPDATAKALAAVKPDGSSAGTITDNGDGTFTYDAGDTFEYLNTGETATDSFYYTVDDGNGGMVTELVSITINGADEYWV